MTWEEFYTKGTYLKENPGWNAEDAAWKAQQVLKMLNRHHIVPTTICDVGCGSGELLWQLHQALRQCTCWGYEISPQALALCRSREDESLRFELKDIRLDDEASFDVILLMDVLEHLEDYFGFLRAIRAKGTYKLFHIPLDMTAQAIIRGRPLLKQRMSVGHLHYFTSDTALAALKDAGYEVLDSFYTPSIDAPARSIAGRLARPLRRFLFAVHKDVAVRLVGGYGLMVLAR